ncbi:MAG: MerR family transcriptional regulator [Chloroflexota bacterium]|nr:MerR family transcriptional regulator [Chloroflexota bacterium]
MDSQRDAPVYNIKAMARLTGVPADTLRRWESRYKVITPQRTESGYRLYSQRDVDTILWLKSKLDEGLSISRACDMLRQLGGDTVAIQINQSNQLNQNSGGTTPSHPAAHASGDLDVSPGGAEGASYRQVEVSSGVRSYEAFQEQLFTALRAIDEVKAADLVSEALSLYSVEDVCISVFQPMLVRVGQAWMDGEISVAIEHFASSFVRARLENLFHSSSHNLRGAFVLLGCAPDELHEIGAMFLALFLRRAGYKVVYLGQNVPIDSLMGMIHALRPDVVCVSATRAETAASLYNLRDRLDVLKAEQGYAPLLAYGGRVFNRFPHISERLGGLYLGEDAVAAVRMLSEYLHTGNRS